MITFEEALQQTENQTRSLLLGNGFSIAASSNFSYRSLREKAISSMSPLDELFNSYDTNDFEKILMALTYADDVNSIFGHIRAAENIVYHKFELITNFINTLQDIHPGNLYSENQSGCMTREQFRNNKIFLHHFVRNIQGCIFTLNYDLLLYWSIFEGRLERLLRDSFSDNDNIYNDRYTPQNDCINYANSTNLFYLHGALHLRTDGYNRTYKITNSNLLLILEDDLNRNIFPTIVFEGTTKEKKQKILNNSYLTIAYNTLRNACGSLFTYGFSFSQNDQHIIDAIVSSRLEKLYVGLYGDERLGENADIRAICAGIRDRRRFRPISIEYFRSDHVSPW